MKIALFNQVMGEKEIFKSEEGYKEQLAYPEQQIRRANEQIRERTAS